MMQDIIYGYTLVSQRCSDCGEVRTKKLTGEFVDG